MPLRIPCLAAVLALSGACGMADPPAASGPQQPSPAAHMAAMDGSRIAAADREPQNWLTHGRTYDEQRFSPLDRINDRNAGELGLAWFLDLGTTLGVQSTPLAIDGILYLSSAWNIMHAVDGASGRELWRYDPGTRRDALRRTCCGATNRGLAAWKGRLYQGTLDGRLIAVDAATGKPVWEVQTTDPSLDYSITGAPRIVNGKVVIGNSGAEFGVRGYVSAYDADDGHLIWRFFTVPGNPADGFESTAMEMAAETWTGEWWRHGGGGTAWDSFAFDPELNLLYIGTGNGAPWPRALRSPHGGDNLFLASIVAVDADTGEYVWHYQTVPGENWDYTATQHMILADLDLDGRRRRVLMQAPKNGFFYVLDRITGELISAQPIVPVNWASHVDPESGRPVEIAENLYGQEAKLITPGPAGAHNWQPMSYSPLSGLVYIPVHWTSYPYSMTADFRPQPMQWNTGSNPDAQRPPEADRAVSSGGLLAWDPARGQRAWEVDLGRYWNGGTLATAGNLVVQGAADERFAIYRADTGEQLWDMPIHTGAVAGPISYLADGEQYIAVAAGWSGAVALWGGDRERARRQPAPTRLLAFRRGGTAKLPPPPGPKAAVQPPLSTADADTIARGRRLYDRSCNVCHGVQAVAGILADLRRMAPETHAQFADIVLHGTRLGGGMPAFADRHTAEEVEAIHAYLIHRANEDRDP
jgi:quinohemoprotein ethanol dehydrogenase